MTYAGSRPEKPKPNAAEIAISAISFCVTSSPVSASACAIEDQISVFIPPILSAT